MIHRTYTQGTIKLTWRFYNDDHFINLKMARKIRMFLFEKSSYENVNFCLHSIDFKFDEYISSFSFNNYYKKDLVKIKNSNYLYISKK